MNSVKAKEIALSIEALRAASNKIKITSELEDALEQLDSIVKLLVNRLSFARHDENNLSF